jgi:hypothetical protein
MLTTRRPMLYSPGNADLATNCTPYPPHYKIA